MEVVLDISQSEDQPCTSKYRQKLNGKPCNLHREDSNLKAIMFRSPNAISRVSLIRISDDQEEANKESKSRECSSDNRRNPKQSLTMYERTYWILNSSITLRSKP